MLDIILTCHLQPNASRTQWVGRHDNALKIRLQAPAVEGKANKALIAFFAEEFAVRKKQIQIISGEQSRHKRIKIIQPKQIPKQVAEFLQEFNHADKH